MRVGPRPLSAGGADLRACSVWSRQFTEALQEKKFQKHVAAEFIGTLLFVFLAGAGVCLFRALRRA